MQTFQVVPFLSILPANIGSDLFPFTHVKVKVKQSRYRPEVAQRVPGS
jgi:hypothetical protein